LDGRFSEKTTQRHAVWRQRGKAIKVQMESLIPDLSKITKAEKIEEVVLMRGCLALKPLQGQTHKVTFKGEGVQF
jgi:hypothetical protein